MSPENFVYWLAGYFEISSSDKGEKGLSAFQVQEIKNHLDLVLKKVTPKQYSLPHEMVLPEVEIMDCHNKQRYCSSIVVQDAFDVGTEFSKESVEDNKD